MLCPYCQEEMQLGYMTNGLQPVHWMPDGARPSYSHFEVAEKAVLLINQFNPITSNGYKAQVHYCPKCSIVIASTKK